MPFKKVAGFTAFRNEKEQGSNRPDFSNAKVQIAEAIPPGEYSAGVWHSESGLSIKLEQQVAEGLAPPPTPTPTTPVADIAGAGGGDDFAID